MTKSIITGLVLAAVAAGTVPAKAQSFNCNYARTPDEVLICNSRELSDLYAWRRSMMEQEQARWLRWRMSCGRDFYCVKRAYDLRIRELYEQQASVCDGRGPRQASVEFCSVGRGDN
jgi:uncharacterized protein